MGELYRYTNTIIAYKLVPKRKYRYIKKTDINMSLIPTIYVKK